MTIAIRRILFPTDFSDAAKEAQAYATALADRFGAELHLLHVIPIVMPYADASSSWVTPENITQSQVEAAEKKLLDQLDSQWSRKHCAKCATVVGFAVDEILNYAKNQEIDLIVVGTHGHSWISHVLIGSVTEKLVRLAKCPVLTVHPKGRQFLMDDKAGKADQKKA